MPTLNLGILAHVDAGKTSLTERLLFAAGVIDKIGRVDDGSTQTDTMALERQRGITIKSAVVSFALDDLTVNLIDTPGHPDFIAEVDRALSVLDGAVLVVSAVEGVQSQTRVLMRALRRLRLPVAHLREQDRPRPARPATGCCGTSRTGSPRPSCRWARCTHPAPGTPDTARTTRPIRFLRPAGGPARRARRRAAGGVPREPQGRLRRPAAGRARRADRAGAGATRCSSGRPMTGAGVAALTTGISEFLPPARRRCAGSASGTVFKVDRGPAGEQITYVRMFSGTVRVRDRLPTSRRPAESRRSAASRRAAARRAAGDRLERLRGGSSVRRDR